MFVSLRLDLVLCFLDEEHTVIHWQSGVSNSLTGKTVQYLLSNFFHLVWSSFHPIVSVNAPQNTYWKQWMWKWRCRQPLELDLQCYIVGNKAQRGFHDNRSCTRTAPKFLSNILHDSWGKKDFPCHVMWHGEWEAVECPEWKHTSCHPLPLLTIV